MLVVGQKTGKYYASNISTNAMYVEYSTIAKDFKFVLVSEVKSKDFGQRVGKAPRVFVIKTDAKIDFKENDKIVWNEKEYLIRDVTEEDSPMTTLLVNKQITMEG